MRSELITRALGFAGLLPFYLFLAGLLWLVDYPRALSAQGFIIYSLAILCFLAGAVWGDARRLPPEQQTLRLLVSNGLVIFAVVSLLTAQLVLAAFLLMLGYLALLWYERRVDSHRDWYSAMRAQLTSGVVIAHLLYMGVHSAGA